MADATIHNSEARQGYETLANAIFSRHRAHHASSLCWRCLIWFDNLPAPYADS
jgi:hypothetical protein